VLKRSKEIGAQIVEWRRDFHMHPELGFEESRTAAKVAEVMKGLGYRVRTEVGKTGVVAELGEGKPVIGIRADMDALPIQETNDVPYASQVPNKMHACGHDAHTSIAMGVATLLTKEEFPGTVRFLFQPAEEVGDDEGISGAPRMIEDGAAEDMDAVIALHVDSKVEVGVITLDDGPSSAGVVSFYITIHGKGGHGSAPHRTVDPIYLAGHVIQGLHGIVSRRIDPFAPAVVTIGSINGGVAENVIPEFVKLTGTIRYMDLEILKKINMEIENALQITKAMGGDYELEIESGDPPAFNHPEMVELIQGAAQDLIGAENIKIPEPSLGAEDFGYFAVDNPGAMFMLGAKIEGDMRKHHSAQFDIDENCLPIGAAILAESALRYLRGKEK
jgi:amidohydrolase